MAPSCSEHPARGVAIHLRSILWLWAGKGQTVTPRRFQASEQQEGHVAGDQNLSFRGFVCE